MIVIDLAVNKYGVEFTGKCKTYFNVNHSPKLEITKKVSGKSPPTLFFISSKLYEGKLPNLEDLTLENREFTVGKSSYLIPRNLVYNHLGIVIGKIIRKLPTTEISSDINIYKNPIVIEIISRSLLIYSSDMHTGQTIPINKSIGKTLSTSLGALKWEGNSIILVGDRLNADEFDSESKYILTAIRTLLPSAKIFKSSVLLHCMEDLGGTLFCTDILLGSVGYYTQIVKLDKLDSLSKMKYTIGKAELNFETPPLLKKEGKGNSRIKKSTVPLVVEPSTNSYRDGCSSPDVIKSDNVKLLRKEGTTKSKRDSNPKRKLINKISLIDMNNTMQLNVNDMLKKGEALESESTLPSYSGDLRSSDKGDLKSVRNKYVKLLQTLGVTALVVISGFVISDVLFNKYVSDSLVATKGLETRSYIAEQQYNNNIQELRDLKLVETEFESFHHVQVDAKEVNALLRIMQSTAMLGEATLQLDLQGMCIRVSADSTRKDQILKLCKETAEVTIVKDTKQGFECVLEVIPVEDDKNIP